MYSLENRENENMEQKIAILIPCYNEEKTIQKVILDFKKQLPEAQIYVCNNNSTDKTMEIATSIEGVIVKNEYNQGKGNVVRRMFREIDADIYVMVDGDDTYPAEEVEKLIKPIVNGESDMTVGDRLSNGTYKNENKRKFHEFGNNLVKKTINLLFNSNLKDIMSGYRAFNKIFVKNIPILSSKFEVETEITLSALDKKFIIKEIPITYKDRPEGSFSKLNTIEDGVKVIKTILKMYKDYRPRKFFFLIALILFMFGMICGIPVLVEFAKTHYITKLPSAVLATGLMLISAIAFQCGLILDTIVKANKEEYELNLIRYEEGKIKNEKK